MGAEEIVTVRAVRCRFEPTPWRFALDRAEQIDAHWRAIARDNPSLFNGRVLLQHRGAVVTGPEGEAVFEGAYLETEFKAFMTWRDLGFPAAGVRNGFGMAALSSSDGAFLVGEMAPHTANAGRLYFPSGTPDPNDVRDGAVDIEGSVRRELAEETGLRPAEVAFDEGFTVVVDESRVGFMKRVRSPEPAEDLAARIHAFLAQEEQPELARMHIIRRVADIGPAVQSSCAAYLRSVLAG